MTSTAAPNSPEFHRNREAYEARIRDLYERRARALIGGPEKARLLHKKRKQLLPRERLAAVLDPGSPFLEFGQLAGDGLYEGVPPGGSIITGVGLVCGRACMLMIHDATVKGGTYYGITAKKQVRAQMFAWRFCRNKRKRQSSSCLISARVRLLAPCARVCSLPAEPSPH